MNLCDMMLNRIEDTENLRIKYIDVYINDREYKFKLYSYDDNGCIYRLSVLYEKLLAAIKM